MDAKNLRRCHEEIGHFLENGILPFWAKNGIDHTYGGYLVNFDRHGKPLGDKEKMLVTQTRMIWGFSAMGKEYKNAQYIELARQGVDFLIDHFWDRENGGWLWTVRPDGDPVDKAKIVYGQTFAVYALSEYTLDSQDPRGLEYAAKTFDLLQIYCTDTRYGGYFENLKADWSKAAYGEQAGDIKSLNITMHMLEAYTTLYECSKREIHRRKLEEIIALILDRFVSLERGCGFDQTGPDFVRRRAISIPRTWTQDREKNSERAEAADTTFYGHNVELVWLLNRAGDILGKDFHFYDKVTRALSEHSLRYGFDYEYGGIYYAGPYQGPATGLEKEWWENFEALTGYLDCYERLDDEKYLDAFTRTWDFVKRYMINDEVGECYQLVSREGRVIDGSIGNLWKAIYHTGRSMLECRRRLERLFAFES